MRHLPSPCAAPRPDWPPARWLAGGGVLLAHGVALALAWQAGGLVTGPPERPAAAPAHPAEAARQPAVLYLAATHPAPAQADPAPAAAPAPQPAPAGPAAPQAATPPTAPPPPPAAVEAGGPGVQVAATFARLPGAGSVQAAPAPAAPSAALPSLEPPSAPGLALAQTPRTAQRPAAALPPAPAPAGPRAGDTRSPQPLPGNPLPAYPEAAREDALEGVVGLGVSLDERGRVLAVQWVRRSGHALLDQAARDAVRTWRFSPALRDGAPVAGILTLSIRFQLNGGVSAPTPALAEASPTTP